MNVRPHSPAGHAAAGRWYAKRGAMPLTKCVAAPSNAERIANYLGQQGALERRPLPVLNWPSSTNDPPSELEQLDSQSYEQLAKGF